MNYSDYLMHYGIKGQKWGVRRFQNDDGSLTNQGKKRYGVGDGRESAAKRMFRKAGNSAKATASKAYSFAKDVVKDRVHRKMNEILPSRMSDKELQYNIDRLKKEQEYKQLLAQSKGKKIKDIKQNTPKAKKDHTFALKVIETLSNVVVKSVTNTATKQVERKLDEVLVPKRKAREEAYLRDNDITRSDYEQYNYNTRRSKK